MGLVMKSLTFWNRVTKSDDCWIWTGPVNHGGYGRASMDGKGIAAHRYAWEETNGPIPSGLQIDHLCRNRLCVRPSHLRVVDARTNVLCGIAPPAINARKTHCPRGHEYVVRKNGRIGLQRQCLICRRERAIQRYYATKTAGSSAGSRL